jgi:DNA-binding Lrp family transcriptional regulator
MVIAYVTIKANTGEADRLKQEVADVEGVLDVHIVAGDVDLIAKIEVDTPGDVKDVAASAVQGIRGVESTQTYIAME